MAGVIDYYWWKGMAIARKYPTWKLKERSPAVQAQSERFAYAMALSKTLTPPIVDAYRELAADTRLTWRDWFIRSYIHGIDYEIWNWPRGVGYDPWFNVAPTHFRVGYLPTYTMTRLFTDIPCHADLVFFIQPPTKHTTTKERRGRRWPWQTVIHAELYKILYEFGPITTNHFFAFGHPPYPRHLWITYRFKRPWLEPPIPDKRGAPIIELLNPY